MQRKTLNSIISRILFHILFWGIFFTSLFIVGGDELMNKNFLFIDLPITLIYTYVTVYIILPFFLYRKKYILLLLSVIAFSLLLSYVRLTNYNYYYYSMFSPEISSENSAISFSLLILNAKDFSFALFIFLAVKYTKKWIRLEKDKLQVENEQLESEIDLMRTQVDHHFLFNTLNNIYSLSVTEPSRTQYAIKKLWGLLDYLVTQSEIKEIRIDRELKLISDYVELERLRYGDRLNFEFKIERNLGDYRIPPLVLYPFIENCFKHGSAIDPGNPWIKISITEMEDRLRFIARNSREKSTSIQTTINEKSETVERIRKRLDFQLPGRYKLKVDEKTGEYRVQLDILY